MKKFIAWVKRHPQKITGFFLVIVGSLQVNSAVIQELVSPRTFAWATIIGGAVVAGLGFINTAIANEAARRFKAAIAPDTHSPAEHGAADHTGNDDVQ